MNVPVSHVYQSAFAAAHDEPLHEDMRLRRWTATRRAKRAEEERSLKHDVILSSKRIRKVVFFGHTSSRPDGSRPSSPQHPKDVYSENLYYSLTAVIVL